MLAPINIVHYYVLNLIPRIIFFFVEAREQPASHQWTIYKFGETEKGNRSGEIRSKLTVAIEIAEFIPIASAQFILSISFDAQIADIIVFEQK